MFTLEAIAKRCTASLRTIDNHFGRRGVISLSLSHTLTARSMPSTLPTCREGCPATVGVRETVGSVVLCRTCVLIPTVEVRSRLGLLRLTCRPPEWWELARIGASYRPCRTSHGHTSCRCSCRRAVSSSLPVSLRWPLQPLLPASGDLRSVLSMPRSEVAPTRGPCPLPGLLRCYRRVCSLMLFTTSCSVAMMIVSKMAPHSDLVSCSVLRQCLMMIPISCVVLLQKAAGFFFEPARATAPASVCLLGVAEPRPCAESVCVSSHRPPSGHPPESALFPRALLASIDTKIDFATEAISKLTGDGLGKWTATEWSYSLSMDVQ